MSSYAIPDSVKCLDGVDYNVVKQNDHFEWVDEFEKNIKKLSLEVFETLGVKEGKTLDIAVKGLDDFQDVIKTKMDELVKLVTGIEAASKEAKQFAVDWNNACKYQIDVKYHRMGEGPTPQKIRWAFESTIQYIIICATHLADQDNDVGFKKQVSDYAKNSIVQSIIDSLENIKNELGTLKTSS